ncbi:MAG: FAD-dependent oxidoreductase [Solirubrobacterales bacterium]
MTTSPGAEIADLSAKAGDREVDVIVVGSGAGGLSTAAVAAAGGASVVVLEKAASLGGTTRKAVGAVWIPDNRFMREAGLSDDHAACVRYIARLARPHRYDPADARLGLAAGEFDGIEEFVENAAEAHERLEELEAVRLRPTDGEPGSDYLGHLPENEAPRGRTIFPVDPEAADGDVEGAGNPLGGQWLVAGLAAAAQKRGTRIYTRAEVRDVVCVDGRVAGVRAATPTGAVELRARAGVVFASGGFTHDRDLRSEFLHGPVAGGCAALSNTGDFVRIAQSLGAVLGNMGEAWLAPLCLEMVATDPENAMSSFLTLGDGLVFVNRAGRRVVNEKLPYNEVARVMGLWDPNALEYSNSPLFAIWDEATASDWGLEMLGNPVRDASAPWVMSGETLADLADQLSRRLERLRDVVGRVGLADDFVDTLGATLHRFGHFADSGVDEDFRRGETPFERYVNGLLGARGDRNPSLRRLAGSGPYFGTILGLGTLDTKGGPRTDKVGRVLRGDGASVEGLFAVGNCAASPFGQGYPAAGSTLGPILTAGHLTGSFLGSLFRGPRD